MQVEYKKLELRGLELQAANAQTTSELGKASQQVQEQQTRISSLEDEKAGLIGRVRRLEPFEKSRCFILVLPPSTCLTDHNSINSGRDPRTGTST